MKSFQIGSSLSPMHLNFFHVFLLFDSSFSLILNHIPLSGCTAVYLFIPLLKDILVAFKFGTYE